MDKKASLLKRLDAIADSLRQSGYALALLGLGSAGLERDRLDEFSDLDFFAIVAPGYKEECITNLDWLGRVCPIVYLFRNTCDGYKLLFQDGIFCEFAVFEPAELSQIPFTAGAIVWKAEGFDEAVCFPKNRPQAQERSVEYLLGEALTNLCVGLSRYRRGEKISGFRFVQQFAVDRVLELAGRLEEERLTAVDPFSIDRRFEFRFPCMSRYLPRFIQGYDRTIESAAEILAFLSAHFDVNPFIKSKIAGLC
jgi:hypothetical protein